MGAHSRNKGRNAERAVEVILQDAGLSTDRNLGGRTQVSGDIAAEANGTRLAVEVRRRESLSCEKWLWEHSAETPNHLTPLLVTRTSRKPWMVCLSLDDFLAILTATNEGENHAD